MATMAIQSIAQQPNISAMTLERYADDGIELYVDRESMMAFASQKGLARICGVSVAALKKWLMVNQIKPIAAEIPTSKGIRMGNLFSHKHVKLAVKHYSPDLYDKFADCGANTFLLGLAGIKITAQVDDQLSVFSVLTSTRREPMPWECMFNSDWRFWAQKTTQWHWDWSVMGRFINWTVYDYLPADVVSELKSLACNLEGLRVRKLHQHLSSETRSLVAAHLDVVLEMMKAANGNQDLFELLMKNRFGQYRKPKELPSAQIPLFTIKPQLIFELG